MPCLSLAVLLVLAGRPTGAATSFDDGRYLNRGAARGALDLGAGWAGGWAVRPAARAGAWWQTRDLDASLAGALLPVFPVDGGAVRPDARADLALDVRPAPRVGLLIAGRALFESRALSPRERGEPWEPWEVEAWSRDLAPGALAAAARLRPVVDLAVAEDVALELGASGAVDRTAVDGGADLRLAGGPRAGLRAEVAPGLSLLGRGQLSWAGVTGPAGEAAGRAWQAWGGLEEAGGPLRLRLLAGWDGGGTGLLFSGRVAVGSEVHRLSLDLRRGPGERWPSGSWYGASLGFSGSLRSVLEGEAALGWRQRAGAWDEPGSLLGRAGLSVWPWRWLGAGAAGFAQADTTRGGLAVGAEASLRIGRVAPPTWVAPGDGS